MSTLTIKALGEGPTIGANSYLLSADGFDVVVDCGLHPKKEGREALPAIDSIESPPVAALLSHAHIDHSGAMPLLARKFPSTSFYATRPTLGVVDRMLHNSVSVMGTLASERGIRDYPLYSHEDVENLMRRAYGLEMEQEFALGVGCPVKARFIHSGHVLGSACVLIEFPGHTVLYSGDVCVSSQELMEGMDLNRNGLKIDTLMIESTRGAQEDGHTISFENECARFAREVSAILANGGVVLVPSFALGRSQELLNVIADMMETGRVPDVPVYASGLGRAIYEVYDRYQDYLRDNVILRPLGQFKRVGDVWQKPVRKELLRKPCIIVATSGMMVENTPSAVIAQDLVQDPLNGIFFAGYLDPDTLGFKLAHCQPGDKFPFEMKGRSIEVRTANIQRFHFSAHANRDDLCSIVNHFQPRNTVFIHGDNPALQWMHDNCTGPWTRSLLEGNEPLELEP